VGICRRFPGGTSISHYRSNESRPSRFGTADRALTHVAHFTTALPSHSKDHTLKGHIAIDDQSASLSWCQGHIWDLRPQIFLSDICVYVDVGHPL
jgi:hypothetical protein